jgi:hypothetical protein
LSYRNTIGVHRHNLKLRTARNVFTRAAAFRTKRLIVFLTPGHDYPAGGILSIAALYRETNALRELHRSRVSLCTIPYQPPLLKYTWFKNRNYLLDLEALLMRCHHLDFLQLHIPELVVNQTAAWLESTGRALLQNIREVHLNVMLQNIDLFQGHNIQALLPFGKVTCTTAHEAYTNRSTRDSLGVPLHRLSCCNGPELYSPVDYRDKESLLLVSNDEHPRKNQILKLVEEGLPNLTIQIIQNLSYEEYQKLIRRAKWSLTFGEGLDGYFVDQVFTGGVAFAVFNERFFTPPFASLENVYPTWEKLSDRLVADLQRLDEPTAYERCRRQTSDLLSELYSTERFRENLRLFYRGEYTFP